MRVLLQGLKSGINVKYFKCIQGTNSIRLEKNCKAECEIEMKAK